MSKRKTKTTPPTPPTDPPVDPERQRSADLADLAARTGCGSDLAGWIRDGVTVDEAHRRAVDAMAARMNGNDPGDSPATVVVVDDETDKRRRGMVDAIVTRAGRADIVKRAQKREIDGGEFRSLRLSQMAERSLQAAGVPVDDPRPDHLVRQALGIRTGTAYPGQTTSDFAVALTDSFRTIVESAYMLAPVIWPRFVGTRPVDDLEEHEVVNPSGSLDTFEKLGGENSEIEAAAIPDAEMVKVQAATYARTVALTRRVILADRLGLVGDHLASLGEAAGRTVEDAVFATLAMNGGLGPTVNIHGHNVTLFHADRDNVGTSATLTIEGVQADYSIMRAQKNTRGQHLAITPEVLLVADNQLPVAAALLRPGSFQPTDLANANTVSGLLAQDAAVGSPRLTGTRRWLFADPAVSPCLAVISVGTDGAPVPQIDQFDPGPTRDGGVMVRGYLDAGVAVINPRAGVTNAGA